MTIDHPPNRASTNGTIDALTSIRFFAAIYVVFHHYGAMVIPSDWKTASTFHSRGGSGVALFFVLSGFILSYNYASRSSISQRDFLAARFARIFPVYLLSMLLAFPPFFNAEATRQPVASALIDTSLQLLLCLALLQAWFPSLVARLNPPGWSLSAEWFFYSVFPFLLTKRPIRRFLENPGLAIPSLWCASLVGQFSTHALISRFGTSLGLDATPDFLKLLTAFNPVLRLPEFLIGCSLGLLHLRGTRIRNPDTIAIASAALSIAALAFLPLSGWDELLCTSLLAPLFGALILSLANSSGPLAALLSLPWLVFLGESSYGLYILHEPVRSWMGWAFDKCGIALPESWKAISMAAASILLAAACFLWVESPARMRLRRLLSTPKPASIK